jgi:hypothetical protein
MAELMVELIVELMTEVRYVGAEEVSTKSCFLPLCFNIDNGKLYKLATRKTLVTLLVTEVARSSQRKTSKVVEPGGVGNLTGAGQRT